MTLNWAWRPAVEMKLYVSLLCLVAFIYFILYAPEMLLCLHFSVWSPPVAINFFSRYFSLFGLSTCHFLLLSVYFTSYLLFCILAVFYHISLSFCLIFCTFQLVLSSACYTEFINCTKKRQPVLIPKSSNANTLSHPSVLECFIGWRGSVLLEEHSMLKRMMILY